MSFTQQYIRNFQQDTTSITPLIIDMRWAILLLERLTNRSMESLEAYREEATLGISLYSRPEDKKLFDISTVQTFIRDIALIPYEKKHIYILRDIDTGSPEAMNALLKILEECPAYAAILLVVTDPNALLPTIHSRCINAFKTDMIDPLPWDIEWFLKEHAQWKPASLASYLHREKIEKNIALSLLQSYLPYADQYMLEQIEWAIIQIKNGFDTPKNMLEVVFLNPTRNS